MNKKKPVYLILAALLWLGFLLAVNIGAEEQASNKAGIPILKWTGPGQPGSYAEYRSHHRDFPFQVEEIDVPSSLLKKNTTRLTLENKIMIFVNSQVYQKLSGKINRYVTDIGLQGYAVHLFEYTGGNAKGLKNFIKDRKQNLLGCVFIGDFPAAWYEVEDDYYEYGYAQFPCDLFFMDLDGKWLDRDGNGIFDLHADGPGDRQPEIFIGRIDASRMDGNQFEHLAYYFDKNHEYWEGNIYLLQFGLTYTEDDWSQYDDIVHDISCLYPGNYKFIKAPDTSRNDYLENRLNNILYEFIQLACHSNSSAHYFTRGGVLNSLDVRNAPPQGMAFNLFCCSALRFTDLNCLGDAYIFNQGVKTLAVIGSTKTGSMLEFRHFYQALRNRYPIGLALKKWFEMIAPYDDYDLFWHYGMTILGDPMLVLLYQQRDVYPPVELDVSQVENRSLLLREYVNLVSWKSNPLNIETEISAYRIYWLSEGELQPISIVDGQTEEFFHRGVNNGARYIYGVASIRNDGLESFPALVEIFNETN
jgi:hypothetical protein